MNSQNYTATYAEQKTFFPFGENKIIGFLGETVVDNWKQPGAPENAPAITGYKYTGTEKDGGTIMPCNDPTSYPEVANAIIRSKYTESDEMAIHRHFNNDPVAYKEEWKEYNQFCEDAKVLAKLWLGIE